MRVLYQETRVKPMITVFLDNSLRSVEKAFHCPGCGFVAFQYYSGLHMLVPGMGPLEDNFSPIVTIQCKNGACKMLFQIYRGI